jgi:hypothetical protein
MTFDPRLVRDTWRRILKSDELVDAMLNPREGHPGAGVLTPDEAAILADYGATPAATKNYVDIYRRALVRAVFTALDLLPLTRRFFEAVESAPDDVVADFTRATGFRDDGPNFWRTADDFLDFIGQRPAFAQGPARDVLAIDKAAVALRRSLAAADTSVWAPREEVDLDTLTATDRFVRRPIAIVAAVSHDLTPWLEDPDGFDPKQSLDEDDQYWLLSLEDPDEPHGYVELSERAARLFASIREPKTASEVATELHDLSDADALEVIGSLIELGVVDRLPAL